MKNVERLARYMTKHGSEGMLIHTIPGTGNWVICQKVEADKWLLSLGSPMGNVTYNLGSVTNKEHVNLWREIAMMEIESKTSQMKMAKELKGRIYQFTKKYEKSYKKFIKRERTKQKRPQYRQRNARSKKTNR